MNQFSITILFHVNLATRSQQKSVAGHVYYKLVHASCYTTNFDHESTVWSQ